MFKKKEGREKNIMEITTTSTTTESNDDDGQQPQTEEEKKKEVSNKIDLRVVNAEGNEIHFKIKKTTSFKRLFEAYAKGSGLRPGSIRYSFDGDRLNKDDTPEGKDMENEDVIDAMIEQIGGEKKKKKKKRRRREPTPSEWRRIAIRRDQAIIFYNHSMWEARNPKNKSVQDEELF
ncbi:MAG: ubiquitin-like protein [Promethearchaeota archaeon]